MGLTLAERKAVTKTIATRYKRADHAGMGQILDELCNYHRLTSNHARKALKAALPSRGRTSPPTARRTDRKLLRRWCSVGRCSA